MLKFVEFNYFIMYVLACLVIIALAVFFGFGMLVHKCATCCSSKKSKRDIELGKYKKEDDIEEEVRTPEGLHVLIQYRAEISPIITQHLGILFRGSFYKYVTLVWSWCLLRFRLPACSMLEYSHKRSPL